MTRNAVSWCKIPQVGTGGTVYTDIAMLTIRLCVLIMRTRGNTIRKSYFGLSDRLKITPRRVRSLLESDGIPVVRKTEWDGMRKRAGKFFLEESARLRELAKAYDTVGEKMGSDDCALTFSELALVGDPREATTATDVGIFV